MSSKSPNSRQSQTLARPASAEQPRKPLILLCDGTWCGRETNTKTNIYKLARLMDIEIGPNDTDEDIIPGRARYIHGVGIGKSFMDYVFDAITAQDIATQCIAVYKFIVLNYTYPDQEIWMFGLSRGAYLVRSVAGMINNCGIIRSVKHSNGDVDEQRTDLLCKEIYLIYRSPYSINTPHSPQSEEFRRTKSWPLIGDESRDDPTAPRLTSPIKFMGLFDTVGSLGFPDFTGGVGLDWPAFYDQNVSTAVENVYHAVSLHDRLYVFQPCLVSRNKDMHTGAWDKLGVTKQEWLPGVHYDLGRQRFRFLREFGGNKLEDFLAQWKFASKVIEPNKVLSDFALRWMLLAIRTHNPTGHDQIIRNIDQHIARVTEKIRAPDRSPRYTGDGDVYGHVVDYAPFGSIILSIYRAINGNRGRVSELYQLFFARRDRLIPEDDANVYDFQSFDLEISENETVKELADVNERRYPSRSYLSWILRRNV
ncbi:hypothetical protein N7467_008971 [Penicillium canescens]|nr:hypothetical protein N7467_008971 [Penicillium canescens]